MKAELCYCPMDLCRQRVWWSRIDYCESTDVISRHHPDLTPNIKQFDMIGVAPICVRADQ